MPLGIAAPNMLQKDWITENNQSHPVPENDFDVARLNIAMATLINRVRTWGK
jgi:hypothetical protein